MKKKFNINDLVKIIDFDFSSMSINKIDRNIPYGTEGIILKIEETHSQYDRTKHTIDFGSFGIHESIYDYQIRPTIGVKNFNDRDRIKAIYEEWTDQVFETCDWKTNFTIDEVQTKYSEIALKYALEKLEEIKINPSKLSTSINSIKKLLNLKIPGYNLFLDDIRDPYDAFNYTKDTDFSLLDWVVVRNYDTFVSEIEFRFKEHGVFPSMIAFDHDLSDEHYEHISGDIPYDSMEEKTGMHCAKWLIDFCIDNNLILPDFKVHSMNPAGKRNIESILENFKKHQLKNE